MILRCKPQTRRKWTLGEDVSNKDKGWLCFRRVASVEFSPAFQDRVKGSEISPSRSDALRLRLVQSSLRDEGR